MKKYSLYENVTNSTTKLESTHVPIYRYQKIIKKSGDYFAFKSYATVFQETTGIEIKILLMKLLYLLTL